jgi:hypothetical protein
MDGCRMKLETTRGGCAEVVAVTAAPAAHVNSCASGVLDSKFDAPVGTCARGLWSGP